MKRKTLVRLERILGSSALILALLIMLIPNPAYAESAAEQPAGNVAIDASASTIGHSDKISATVNGTHEPVILEIADTDRHRLEALCGGIDPDNQVVIAYDMSLVKDASDTPASFSSISITLPVPEGMDPENGRIQVICENDGKYQELSYSMKKEGSTYYVTFTTTHFSDYGFLYTKNLVTPEIVEGTPQDDVLSENELKELRSSSSGQYQFTPQGYENVTMNKEGVCDVGMLGTLHYQITGADQNCTLRIFAPDGATSVATDTSAFDLPDYTYLEGAGTYDYPWRYFVDDITTIILEEPLHNVSANAFAGLKNVKNHVVIPDSVETIGATAFQDCTSMRGVTIGSGVIDVGDFAFENSGILEVNFEQTGNLASVGVGAFMDCIELTSVTWPDNVPLAESLFENDESLRSVNLPQNGVITEIPARAFCNCTGVARNGLSIPLTVTNIAEYAFMNLGDEGDLQLPDGLTDIGDYAFYGAHYHGINPQTLRLNGTIYSGANVFPASVTNIGNRAFAGCDGPAGVLYFGGDGVAIGDRAFSGDDIPYVTNSPTIGADEIGNSRAGQYEQVLFEGTATVGQESFAEQPYLSSVYFGEGTGIQTAPAGIVPCDTVGDGGYVTQSFPTHVTLHYPMGAAGWDSPFYGSYPTYPDDFKESKQWTSFAYIDDNRSKKDNTEAIMAIVGDNSEIYTLDVEDSEGKNIKKQAKLNSNQKLKAYELTLYNEVDEKAKDFGVCKIYLPLPSGMKADDANLEVVAIKDGEIERNLPSGVVTYREDGIKRIWFTTDHFSEYGLIYEGAQDANNNNNNNNANNTGTNAGTNNGNNAANTAAAGTNTPAAATATPAATTAGTNTPAATTATPSATSTTSSATTATGAAQTANNSNNNTTGTNARASDMPKTGEGDEVKILIVLLLALFGGIMWTMSIPTRRKLAKEHE